MEAGGGHDGVGEVPSAEVQVVLVRRRRIGVTVGGAGVLEVPQQVLAVGLVVPELARVRAARLVAAYPKAAGVVGVQVLGPVLQPCADGAAGARLYLARKGHAGRHGLRDRDGIVRNGGGDALQLPRAVRLVGDDVHAAGVAVGDQVLRVVLQRVRQDVAHGGCRRHAYGARVLNAAVPNGGGDGGGSCGLRGHDAVLHRRDRRITGRPGDSAVGALRLERRCQGGRLAFRQVERILVQGNSGSQHLRLHLLEQVDRGCASRSGEGAAAVGDVIGAAPAVMGQLQPAVRPVPGRCAQGGDRLEGLARHLEEQAAVLQVEAAPVRAGRPHEVRVVRLDVGPGVTALDLDGGFPVGGADGRRAPRALQGPRGVCANVRVVGNEVLPAGDERVRQDVFRHRAGCNRNSAGGARCPIYSCCSNSNCAFSYTCDLSAIYGCNSRITALPEYLLSCSGIRSNGGCKGFRGACAHRKRRLIQRNTGSINNCIVRLHK